MTYADQNRVAAWLDDGGGKGLTTLDRAVLLSIAEFSNSRTGKAYPGIDRLAVRWNVDKDSIKRSIRRLRQAGLVETVARGYWGRRAEYVLAGEVAGVPTGHPDRGTDRSPKGGPKPAHRVTQRSSQGDRHAVTGGPTGHPSRERSRSDSGEIRAASASATAAGDGSANHGLRCRRCRHPWRATDSEYNYVRWPDGVITCSGTCTEAEHAARPPDIATSTDDEGEG